jgi:hypothetical protein
MRKYFGLSTVTSSILLAVAANGQVLPTEEIPVVSEYVGTTIDIPEQEYYQIFDKVRGFLSAQFQETPTGFEAVVQTERRWLRRRYTEREFYDLALRIDLTGPIDPEVWKELSGQVAYEATIADLDTIPTEVTMILFLESGKGYRGVYQGFDGRYFNLRARMRDRKVPLVDVLRIWYREGPVPDLEKDIRIYAITALLGMVVAEGWNSLAGIDDFDSRWRNRFIGGLGGLCFSPRVVHWLRIRRAPVHTLKLPREIRSKIDTFSFITYGER